MPDLVLEGLHKRFGTTEVVKGIDLRVPDGSIVALLGGSGSGKTTTLRLIAGLEVPDQGVVRLGDRALSDGNRVVPPEQRKISMVFQSYALWPHLDVLHNVIFPLQQARVPDAPARARALLDRLQLAPLAARYPHELSGGQQQRVALARALVADPELLLLDEPLSNLDPELRAEVREEIRGLVEKSRRTTVLVTHDREDAFAIADTVALLHEGRVAQHGTARELYEAPLSAVTVRFFGAEELMGERDGDVVRVQGVAIPAHPTREAPERGPCRVAFRVQDASLAADGIAGVARGRTFFGTETRCRVQIGSEEVRVLGEVDVGAPVRVHIRRGFALPP